MAPTGGATTKSGLDNRLGASDRSAPSGKGIKVGLELQPRRRGHDPESCSTCQVVAAISSRRLRQEVRALHSGRLRIVDFREQP
jgi:hypothetical protein